MITGQSEWTTEERARHWDAAYTAHRVDGVSWYQAAPSVSLALIEALGVGHNAAIVDVGGGTSTLAERLIGKGYRDVSVLDVSAAALREARRHMADPGAVSWLQEDLLDWRPKRRFDLWHDRAVFHFLVAPNDRERYLGTLRSAIREGGAVVLATFAADGPVHCSGLPVHRYSAEDLASLLGPGFDVATTSREEHITPRGSTQPFAWIAGRLDTSLPPSRDEAAQTRAVSPLAYQRSQASADPDAT